MKKHIMKITIGLIVISIGFGCFGESPPVDMSQYDNIESTAAITTPTFILAGAPVHTVEGRTYDALLTTLDDAGVDAFMATFQYQEIPEPKALGYAVDFLEPCEADGLASIQSHKVDLIVPADLLYVPDATRMPKLEKDPLKKLIDRIGRDNIFAVVNFDEPGLNNHPLSAVAAVYARVKEIDPSIPVLMVHPPLFADSDKTMTEADRQARLADALTYSAYADVIGFDVYTVPTSIGKITSPYANGAEQDHRAAFPGYFKWLRENLPDKQYLMVLQGFAFSDLYEPTYLKSNLPQELIAQVRPPTKAEIQEMVDISLREGASVIGWWGQAAVGSESTVWTDILEVVRRSQ